jgi:very-short-patch-repair endonuclease
MNKTEFIIRQLRRAHGKGYESYVITRLWHLLNRTDIKFITQQYVSRPDGSFALTDLFLPQFKLHIEVDEPQHFTKESFYKESDAIREADIVSSTGHAIHRIDVDGKSIEDINIQIDSLLEKIRAIIEAGEVEAWDYEYEYSPITYIKKGYISLADNVSFRTIADACNCFGHSYKGCQKAFIKHPFENKMLWFPKLYENNQWDNRISLDEKEIYEIEKNNPNYLKEALSTPKHALERIVFARVRSNLGDVMYRFKGIYKIDPLRSEQEGCVVYLKLSDQCKTYPPKIQ